MKIKKIAILSQALVLSAAMVPMVSAASENWGPQDRATFTWDKPASYPVFNSITNNPTLGDERNFVRVREADTNDTYSDNVDLEVGKEYEVYTYVHNNASASLNESGKGIASGVMIKAELPTKLSAGEAAVVKSTITADNTNPKSVYDTAFMHANSSVYLRYVPNSAVIHNAGSADGQILDADSLFGAGAGYAYYNSDWGLIPGCNEYAGYVTYRVKVDQPDFTIDKTAAVNDSEEYADEVSAKPGDTVEFKINYKNNGTTAQENVTVHDNMPEGLEYVAGSTYITTTADSEGKSAPDGYLFDAGLNIGNFQAGEIATITYSAKVSSSTEDFDCGDTVVYNDASVASPNGTEYDKVKIKVTRDDCLPAELPKTGPTEIIAASIILLLIGIGGTYWIVSLNRVRKVTSAAAGEEKSPSDIVKDGFIEK